MLKKVIKTLKNILIAILVLLIIISIVGQARKYLEKDDVKPLGVLVNVHGKKCMYILRDMEIKQLF